MFYLTPLRVNQIEFHPTELCACTTVGTALKTILRGIAHPRVTHAQRTVHEAFQLHVRHGLVDGFYLGKRQFARQYNALEAQTMQPSHLLGRPIVGLRTGMEGRQRLHVLGQQVEYGHVLHQQRVDTHLRQGPQERARVLKFVLVDNGVDRDIHLGAELMGIEAQLTDVVQRVASRCPRAKL